MRNRSILWNKEDVIKVVQLTRGVDGRSKSKIIRTLTAQCHDASPLPISRDDLGDCNSCGNVGASVCNVCINGSYYIKEKTHYEFTEAYTEVEE